LGLAEVAVPLGEAFHSRRLRLLASQVGEVAPSHRVRWTRSQRLAAALELLTDPALDALLAPAVRFEDLPAVWAKFSARRPTRAARSSLSWRRIRSRGSKVFAVEVSDQIMIAHSFQGAVFGPAQQLHGATFVVRAAFMAEQLDPNGIVIDIGFAHAALKTALGPLAYRNLDDLPQFKGINTTTEFVTKHVFDQLAEVARSGSSGATDASSRPSASRCSSRPRPAPGTRRRCGEAAAFVVPGDLATPTAATPMTGASSRSCARLGWQMQVLDIGEGFPSRPLRPAAPHSAPSRRSQPSIRS